MKISDSEKLILAMLSQIHQKLEINDGINPEFIQDAIYSDNTWAISWEYSGIPFDNIENPSHVKEVVNYLDMWSFIEGTYSNLSEEDKTKLEKISDVYGKNPIFPGFDGNNECDHLNVTDFLIDKLGRFTSFKGRDLNSHMPMLDLYSRMYSVFEPIRKDLFDGQLSVEQLGKVLNERVHPSNR